MTVHSVAFVGTGPNPAEPVWGESAAMAYRHADGYRRPDDCDLVACADIVREHGEAFADEFGIDAGHVYEDYEEMLAEAQPDIVSVATPVPTHADIVVDLIESGSPSAIHCEKPMADTWADCERMAAAAADADVQLTFNHQRRFDPRCRSAKDLLDETGLDPVPAHVGIDRLEDDLSGTLPFYETLGIDGVVVPWLGPVEFETRSRVEETIDRLASLAERVEREDAEFLQDL